MLVKYLRLSMSRASTLQTKVLVAKTLTLVTGGEQRFLRRAQLCRNHAEGICTSHKEQGDSKADAWYTVSRINTAGG